MKHLNVKNTNVLANAVQLSTEVIRRVSGNEISDTIDGVEMKEILAGTVAAKLNSKLSKYKGGN
jgi:NADPH-dependent curcumin reductase CurA